jgi:hypothetical protein
MDAPSEIDVVDVVMKIACCEMSFEQTHRQLSDLVWNHAVRILVDDGNLVTLRTSVRIVVSELRIREISIVDYARIRDCQVGRRLKINLVRSENTLKE